MTAPITAPLTVAVAAGCGLPVGPRLPDGCGYASVPDATVGERLLDAALFPIEPGWPAIVFWAGTALIVIVGVLRRRWGWGP